jgi:hypothetical protein
MASWIYDISTGKRRRQSARRAQRGTEQTQRTELPPEELQLLDRYLVGHVVVPGDDRYEFDRKLFNRRFDPRPVAILHCSVEHDVALSLEVIRRQKMPFRIRSGGNSFAGYSGSNGVIIDISGLDDVFVDSTRAVATVGSGCSLAKLQSLLSQHRLHLPLGDAKNVRLGGFMQGGGFGLTSRTYGMNSDHVIEARIMLADGRIVRASRTRNRDLWWAVRGGTGGNFGVLLTICFQLQPAREQNAWSLGWRLTGQKNLDNAVAGLTTLQASFTRRNSHPEMNASVTVLYVSETPLGPPKSPWLVMWGTYVGDESDLDSLLDPLLSTPGCWPRFEPLVGYRNRLRFDRYSRLVSRHLRPDEWRSILSYFLMNAPNRDATLQIDLWGGAIGLYPRKGSAFTHRDSMFNMALTTWWQHPTEEPTHKLFLSGWGELMLPLWNGEIYQNFPSADAPDYRRNYWGPAYPALAAIKRKYDPEGIFVFPQAISSGTLGVVNWPSTVRKYLIRPIEAEA